MSTISRTNESSILRIEGLPVKASIGMGSRVATAIDPRTTNELALLKNVRDSQDRMRRLPMGGYTFGDRSLRFETGDTFVEVEIEGVGYRAMATSSSNKNASYSDKTSFAINTGPCLFGGMGAIAICEGREVIMTDPEQQISVKVDKISLSDGPSVYEIDYFYRQASFIARVAKQNLNLDTIYMNIPKNEYYLYAASAYGEGYLSKAQMEEWIFAVDRRAEFTEQKMREQVDRIAGRRLNYLQNMPMRAIESYVKSQVSRGERVELGEISGLLKNDPEYGELWRLKLERRNRIGPLLPQREFVELSRIGYALAIIRNVPFELAITVENSEEFRIMEVAKPLRKELAAIGYNFRSEIAGVYPVREIINSRNLFDLGKMLEIYFTPTSKAQKAEIEKYMIERYKVEDMGLRDVRF